MITRLRPRWTDDQLAEIYRVPHDHRQFGRGHAERVAAMIELGYGRWYAAADLSCGNGAVLDAIDAEVKYYGDIAPGYDITGPIEKTIEDVPSVDLFVMGETLEHLDDPGRVLVDVAAAATNLLLSTPIENWGDSNAEHYWSWDQTDVEGLLKKTGWETIVAFTTVDSREWGEPYCYGIWRVAW